MILIFFFFFSQNLVSDEIFLSAEICRNVRNDPKYAEIFFFFFIAGVSEASEPRRSCVGAASARVREMKKKKKKRTLAGHRNPASRTRSGVRHVSDTDTTPKMACPCNLGYSESQSQSLLNLIQNSNGNMNFYAKFKIKNCIIINKWDYETKNQINSTVL